MIQIKTYKIFTSGKMGGLSFHEQMEWREAIQNLITERTEKDIIFVHPPIFYQYKDDDIESREWEISQLQDSDIVIVDLSTIADSIGTHIELGIIEAINQTGNKHIYTVGIGKPNIKHPWISLGIFHQEDTLEDAADYITQYLIL